jgi:DNA (cytosine-5)-methyltransferase 1
MKILELFAGIGACSKALERLGINVEIVDAVEIDKYAMASFNAIHNTKFQTQDITTYNKDLKDIDLITHGSPCQDFSVAGKQAGGDLGSGTRSSLMYETIRIVGQVRPKYVLWENVKNILSKKHKHNFDAYIETMNVLGYNSYYQVLNAKDYGIPQNRERVYTVSIRKDIDKGKFKFPEKEELKLRLKDMLEDEVDEKYYLSEKMQDYVLDFNNKQNGTKWEGRADEEKLNTDIAHAIGVRSAGGNQRAGVSNFIIDGLDEEIKVKDLKLRIKNATKKGYDEAVDGDSVNLQYPDSNTRRGRVGHQVSQTLMANDSMGVVNNYRIRKLTPKECWRLMRF